MSQAEELFGAGDLAGCIAQLQSEVRRQPADAKLRVFHAQLLMLTGDWERALNQLSVAADLDAGALPMKHAYSAAIQCERIRADVFAGQRSPLVFGEPLPWIASLLQALSLDASGQTNGGEQFAGLGQRVLTSDAEELGLLEVRELVLGAAVD